MSDRSTHLVFDPEKQAELSQYLVDLFVHQTTPQADITTTTTGKGLPQIDLRPEEGWMLYFLTRLVQARQAVEIGTLAGYSASWIARALPPDGKLYTCEYSPEHAAVARENLNKAGLGGKVEILVGDAHQTLRTLTGEYDLIFIDADKTGYPDYLEWTIQHLRKGGLLVAHNAFQHGDIVSDDPQRSENVKAMQVFNEEIARSAHFVSTVIPAGDGLLVAMVQ